MPSSISSTSSKANRLSLKDRPGLTLLLLMNSYALPWSKYPFVRLSNPVGASVMPAAGGPASLSTFPLWRNDAFRLSSLEDWLQLIPISAPVVAIDFSIRIQPSLATTGTSMAQNPCSNGSYFRLHPCSIAGRMQDSHLEPQ